MHVIKHEGRTPRFLRQISQSEVDFVRGNSQLQNPMFFVANTEDRLAKDHPLRAIKRRADGVLKQMARAFDAAYSETGRPGIPPEALLLQALYSIPSERRLVDALNWNLLYRWFCDLDPDQAVWDATAFTHNRERFERHGLVQKFFERVVATALVEQYASNDHFTVDGTLIQSWASLKSFRPKDEPVDRPPSESGSNPSVDFRGEKRTNATHRSTTDPEARLARRSDGTPALLCHSGHALMENRHGLCLDIAIAVADGHAERDTAEKLLRRFRRRHGVKPKTVSGDRGFEAGEFLRTLEEDLRITPHVPIRAERVTSPGPAGDARRRMLQRMKTKGYALSQRARKKIEQMFGWMKQAGGLRKVRHVGRWKIQQLAYLWAAAFNLLRLAHLEAFA
jgi:transposase